MFIAVEGIDGSGKSTQVQMLAERIRREFPSAHVVETADPAGSRLARQVRQIVTTMEVSPFAQLQLISAARSENWHKTIRPALESGSVVITDRWLLSSLVYQNELTELALHAHALGCDGRFADISFVIDVVPLVAQYRLKRRGSLDRLEAVPLEVLEARRAGFLAHCNEDDVFCVRGMASQEVVHEAIWAMVQTRLADVLVSG